MGAEPDQPARHRRAFTLAAFAAGAVTVVFATVGDGVDAQDATGARAAVVDHGHTATWALLASAFVVAAVRGRWARVSQGLATAGGVCYAVFLAAVLL